MLIIGQSQKAPPLSRLSSAGAWRDTHIAGPAQPSQRVLGVGWVVFPSFSNARPSSLLPAPCAPGCGNPIANLAHVIRRPVRLLSALPCLAFLRTLIETGIPWPSLASCPRVSLTRPRICAANAIAQLLPSPRPTRHPLPSPASQLRLPRADGIRRLRSTGLWLDRGGEWTDRLLASCLCFFLTRPPRQLVASYVRTPFAGAASC